MASSGDSIQTGTIVLSHTLDTTDLQRLSTRPCNNVHSGDSDVIHAETVDRRHDRRMACLIRSSLFRGLSREQYSEMADACDEVSYLPEEVIFLQEQPVRQVLIVASGVVRVSRITEAGKEALLRLEGPGDLLDDSVAPYQRHSVCARAKEESILLAWKIEQFQRLSGRIHAIERNMVGIIHRRLQALQDRFCDLSTRPAPQRLARLVIQLANGPEATSASSFVLSREELAQMTGTSLFTVSRLLSNWAESDIVTLDRRRIVIEKMDRLKALAEAA